MGEKLIKYSEKCKTLSKAKVYESDREIAAVIKNVPTDKKSIERFSRYKFAIKPAQ